MAVPEFHYLKQETEILIYFVFYNGVFFLVLDSGFGTMRKKCKNWKSWTSFLKSFPPLVPDPILCRIGFFNDFCHLFDQFWPKVGSRYFGHIFVARGLCVFGFWPLLTRFFGFLKFGEKIFFWLNGQITHWYQTVWLLKCRFFNTILSFCRIPHWYETQNLQFLYF